MDQMLLEPASQVAFIDDQNPVQGFAAQGADDALADGVHPRRSRQGGDDLRPFGCEDLPEYEGDERDITCMSDLGRPPTRRSTWSAAARLRHVIRYIARAGTALTAGRPTPARRRSGGNISLAEAADAFLAISRTASPNTHHAYASAIDRVIALLGRGILAGVLLSRREVQRWSLPTVAVRVVRQPPDGAAFDLRSAALRQGRGKFGCLMIVVTVLMLLVAGAIGATLPAGRETDSPNYIASMVGVVLVVFAGYVWIDVRARAMGVLTVTDRHRNEHPWSRVRSAALS
jgi:hypothetical protein